MIRIALSNNVEAEAAKSGNSTPEPGVFPIERMHEVRTVLTEPPYTSWTTTLVELTIEQATTLVDELQARIDENREPADISHYNR